MNKKQKKVVFVSVLLFLFVTLNPSFPQMGKYDIIDDRRPFFTQRPMYQYWAIIAVPAVALYYHFKDKKDKKPKDDQKQ